MRSVMICVDDDKYMLHALADQLNEWFGQNYIIEKALSGDEGLLIIDEYKGKMMNISVVISDYIMPIMRGDQFLEKVREKDAAIKKIMLTGYSAIDGIINAINKAGLYRFISKPWDNKDLMLTVLEAIKSYEQDQTMVRLTSGYKALYDRYAGMHKDLQACYDTTLTTIIGAMDKHFGRIVSASGNQTFGSDTHSLAVSYYAMELAKAMKMTKEEQGILGSLGLLHEVGKLNLSDEELIELERSRSAADYSQPAAFKLHEQTKNIMSTISETKFSGILSKLNEKYKPDLPASTRVLAVADAFDILAATSDSIHTAHARLLKYADDGILDPTMVKTFIKNVQVYKN